MFEINQFPHRKSVIDKDEEAMAKAEVIKELAAICNQQFGAAYLIIHTGVIVGATFSEDFASATAEQAVKYIPVTEIM